MGVLGPEPLPASSDLPLPPAAAAAACCRPLDPEPLKLLKMEMRVALKDEDYAAAARIR